MDFRNFWTWIYQNYMLNELQSLELRFAINWSLNEANLGFFGQFFDSFSKMTRTTHQKLRVTRKRRLRAFQRCAACSWTFFYKKKPVIGKLWREKLTHRRKLVGDVRPVLETPHGHVQVVRHHRLEEDLLQPHSTPGLVTFLKAKTENLFKIRIHIWQGWDYSLSVDF